MNVARKIGKRRRGRASKIEREEALAIARQLGVEVAAQRTGFREKIIRRWLDPSTVGTHDVPDPVLGSAPLPRHEEPPHKPGDPAKAFAAIGVTPEARDTEEPSTTPPPSLPPAMSPEELMAFIEGIDGVILSAVLSTKYPGMEASVTDPVVSIAERDRKLLTMMAPFAANYTPTMMQYLGPAMALVFVGTWSFSVVSRVKILARLHAEQFPKMHEKKS